MSTGNLEWFMLLSINFSIMILVIESMLCGKIIKKFFTIYKIC